MKKRFTIWKVFTAAAMMMMLTTPFVLGQRGLGLGKGIQNYDMDTEVTIKGTIVKVKEVESEHDCGRMGRKGIHLVVDAGDSAVIVHLGPTKFIEKQDFSLEKGDQVEIIGSKVTLDNKDVLIARQVKKGDKVLILRNEQGIPAWSRGGRF